MQQIFFGYGLHNSSQRKWQHTYQQLLISGDIWVNDLKYKQNWLVLLIFEDIDGPYRRAAKLLMSTEMP